MIGSLDIEGGKKMADGNILFLDIQRFEDGRILRGGVLVTDTATEPLEFRCTSGIRPSTLQKILWGARLSGHIAAHLIGKPLVQSLQQSYSLVVVQDPEFFELRESMDIPMVRLTRHGEIDCDVSNDSEHTPSTQSQAGENETGENGSLLNSASGSFEPVVLSCGTNYQNDVEAARTILRPLFQARDVLEPFSRIQAALEAVHETEKKKEAK
jgi:hypothetical protein